MTHNRIIGFLDFIHRPVFRSESFGTYMRCFFCTITELGFVKCVIREADHDFIKITCALYVHCPHFYTTGYFLLPHFQRHMTSKVSP
jgi:hypothetical protein